MRTSQLSRLFVAMIAVALPACHCIDVPASDSTNPRASLLVTFTDPDQAGMVSQQVDASSSSLAPPPNLRLPNGWPIQVIYSGHDAGGVKTLRIDLDYLDPTTFYNADGTISSILIAGPAVPDGDFSDCAMESRVLSFDWTISGHWNLKVTAIDFHGNAATTATINLGEE